MGPFKYVVKLEKGDYITCKKYEVVESSVFVDGWEGENEVTYLDHHLVFSHPYADKIEVFENKEELNKELKKISMIFPTAKFQDIITQGISISKTRIAMLHINGSMTDLVSLYRRIKFSKLSCVPSLI